MRWNVVMKWYKSTTKSCALVAGGGDSDVMIDMLIRCGAAGKTDFVFFDTGLEYAATKEHLAELEEKYSITIQRERAIKPIPLSTKEHGQPFWSKYASDMIERLQAHGFKWEDRPFEELYAEYPNCKTALVWWCNVTSGKTDQYAIKRAPYLKEFMMEHPPAFKISNKCCRYAKKKVSEHFMKGKDYDLSCIGIRQSEGGVRAATYKTCFSEGDKVDHFRPIFWLRDSDKEQYCQWYGVTHSRCYTEYGLKRTGCFGCPFGKRFEDELSMIQEFEPNLYTAANYIFKDAYEYTRQYLKYREEMKKNERSNHK